ncbi:MAG TPA: polyketide synthase dehydratase domain-containing protein, partial [Thermoanaerobaculia bacterium]
SEEINPYIRLEETPFYVVRENRPWTRLQNSDGAELPLRAGVSSFGFGGVNSHVVIEEYAGAGDVSSPAGPVMVVLSAKDAARLKEQATQLRTWIGRHGVQDRDLAGLAYTLQVGREAMEHRLALTVSSMSELEAKLGAFLEGRSGVDGLHRGEVTRNSETLALFRGDEELREAIAKWMQRGKWSKLLELWVKGLDIEWEQLYGAGRPRRVSLPTYPFATVRCWIDVPPAKAAAAAAVLHPLLHRNVSDLVEQRYTSLFSGEEFFLADHQVRTGSAVRKVLPGVAYLEMARAAIHQASRNRGTSIVELRDTVWLEPVVITEPAEVSITLAATENDSVRYEIRSGDEDETVHCRGEAFFREASAPARLDLESLRRQMTERVEASALYALCDRMGLHYGAAHRGITEIDLGTDQLLAQLRVPESIAPGQLDFVLHPSLMDSALQASLLLFVDRHDVPANPPVPFAIDSVRIVAAPAAEMLAWVRQPEAGKVDIDLCDASGNVCVQLRGLASRLLDGGVRSQASAPRIPIKSNASFDDAFYETLLADIVNRKVSIEEAAELE